MNLENINRADQESNIPHNLPRISIIIPFVQKMNTKTGFDYIVNAAVDNTEKELMKNYTENTVVQVVKKLHQVLQSLNYKTHSKSIGIFISPLAEKVYYFDYTTPAVSIY